jgi:hypothetical protein
VTAPIPGRGRTGAPAGLDDPRRQPQTRSQFAEIAVMVSLCAYAVALPLSIASGDYDLYGGLLIAPVLIIITVPILRRVTAKDDIWVRRIILAGLYTKLLGAFVRYIVTFSVLGAGDADGYHRSGAVLGKAFRGFHFSGQAYHDEVPKLVGTGFIRLITGIVYMISPTSELSGFMIFSWLGFWGLFLFYRAFRLAVPDGNNRRYAVLVFFLPSLVFWPSSIGKEAWMMFCLGLIAYGAARLYTHQRFAFPVALAGLWGTAMVRPHVTLISFIALSVGYIVRPTRTARSGDASLRKVFGIVLLVIVGALVLSRAQSFFNVDSINLDTTNQIVTDVQGQTTQGSGEFDSPLPSSPIQYPGAVVSVLFRPFPWEASSSPAAISSLEGILLLFVLCNPRRLRGLPSAFIRRPYVAFASVYAALFVFAFSAIGNFGILVRERTQVFPFVLVLASLPLAVAKLPPLPSRRSLRSSPTESA